METIIENKTTLRHKVADLDSLYIEIEKLVDDKILSEKLVKNDRSFNLENLIAQIFLNIQCLKF